VYIIADLAIPVNRFCPKKPDFSWIFCGFFATIFVVFMQQNPG